ncbi:MAG: nitroreductase family protein [Syntrophorhabdaceae bacterium]|nr:nitroreductase family protein [Syntrophorhabdaceae bacterium]
MEKCNNAIYFSMKGMSLTYQPTIRIFIEIDQNLYLAAEILGLGACAIGAFYGDEANKILSLDGIEETVIYMAAVSRPAEVK